MSAKRLKMLLKNLTQAGFFALEYQLSYRKSNKQMIIFDYFKKQINQNHSKQEAKHLADFLKEVGISKSYWKILVKELVQQTEDFLISQSLAQSPDIRSLLLRKIYREKAADELFLQTVQKVKKEQNKQHLHSDNLIHRYWLEREELEFLSIKAPRKIGMDDNFRCLFQLDVYYIIQRIKLMMEITMWNLYSPKIDIDEIPLYQEINHLLDNQQFENHVLFKLYKIAFNLLIEKTDDYQRLSKLLQDRVQDLAKEDLYYIYTILINFLITKKSVNNTPSILVYELYKEMIQYGFLEIQNFVPPGKFKNVVTTACIFKEYDWALAFINDNQTMIEPSIRESVVQFNYGVVYFYQKNLDLAQECLTKVEYVTIFYALDSKSILARVYFEKGEFYALIRFLASFKDFVRKHPKLSRPRKEGYLNYIKILQQIVNTKRLVVAKRYQEKLLEKLNNQSIIYYRDWLKQKILEL